MLALAKALFVPLAGLMKLLWMPAMVTMLVTTPSGLLMRLFKVPEQARERVAAILRWVSIGATALVLLGFVLLFGGLWIAGEDYKQMMNR